MEGEGRVSSSLVRGLGTRLVELIPVGSINVNRRPAPLRICLVPGRRRNVYRNEATEDVKCSWPRDYN